MSCLPDIPPANSHYALVIVLTTLQQRYRESLESILQDGRESSNKIFAFVYCIDNRFQRQLEQLGRDGSTGQIYHTATEASNLGWKQLVIVDSLSREQLTGNARPGRDTEVSVVYVQIDRDTGDGLYGKSSEETHVMAKRMHILDARKALVEQKPLSSDLSSSIADQNESPEAYYDAGILLYDPSKSVYDKSYPSIDAPNPIANAIKQVFALQPPLPPEVILRISEFAQEECELKHMTAAPAKYPRAPRKLHVYSLIRMSIKETKHLEDLYNKQLRDRSADETCTIHQWTASRPANRRDLWRLHQCFFDANRCMDYPVFLFIGWPGWQKDTEIGVLRHHYEFPQPTRRMTIREAIMQWQPTYGLRYAPYYGSDGSYDDPAFELILDPHARFFYDPPPFVSLSSNTVAMPVFFLTRHITKKQTSTIKGRLCKTEEFEEGLNYPEIAFVEWHSNIDGSKEDMWRLLWECCSYQGWGGAGTAMFVDKQTVSDGKVIVATVMLDRCVEGPRSPVQDAEYDSYTGMQYWRQPLSEVEFMWHALDKSDMVFEDFFGPGGPSGKAIHSWVRPDIVWESSGFEDEDKSSTW